MKEDDVSTELFYTCAAENKILKDYKFGNPFQFMIVDKPKKADESSKYFIADKLTNKVVGRLWDHCEVGVALKLYS